jgi:hypothetical protein
MAQGMVFPQTNRPQDVNVSLIRIANMNNKDIDMMQQEVKRMEGKQTDLNKAYNSQIKRWQNYRETYDAVVNMYSLLNGSLTYEDIVKSFPGFEV